MDIWKKHEEAIKGLQSLGITRWEKEDKSFSFSILGTAIIDIKWAQDSPNNFSRSYFTLEVDKDTGALSISNECIFKASRARLNIFEHSFTITGFELGGNRQVETKYIRNLS